MYNDVYVVKGTTLLGIAKSTPSGWVFEAHVLLGNPSGELATSLGKCVPEQYLDEADFIFTKKEYDFHMKRAAFLRKNNESDRVMH